MNKAVFAEQIGLTEVALDEVLDCLDRRCRLDHIRELLGTQYHVRLSNTQWAAIKKMARGTP